MNSFGREILARASWQGLFFGLFFFTAGCVGTFKDIGVVSFRPPPVDRPSVVVLGDLRVTDSRYTAIEQRIYEDKFRLGFKEWLQKTNLFTQVMIESGVTPPPGSALVSGVIQEVEKGSQAARVLVGMGAGQARVQGEFVIQDPGGFEYARFRANRTYLGGTGLGGFNMIAMEELAFRLGASVAEAVAKWMQGKKLD